MAHLQFAQTNGTKQQFQKSHQVNAPQQTKPIDK